MVSVLDGKICGAVSEAQESMRFRLLEEFRRLLEGRAYMHRASTQGDFVAMHL